MDHFAGLAVSVKDTSVCIEDDAGRIVGEVKVVSEPAALLAASAAAGTPLFLTQIKETTAKYVVAFVSRLWANVRSQRLPCQLGDMPVHGS